MRLPGNCLSWVMLLVPQLLSAQVTSTVAHVTLNTDVVHRIPVGIDRATTVMLPGPISGLEGAFISQQPSLEARFQLSHQLGSPYFTLRALATNVTANLNVILGREVLALELVESRQPAYVIDFDRSSPSRQFPLPGLGPPKPARLPATFETAKNYARLRSENAEAIKAIQYARPNQTWDYGDHWIRLEEVFRFDDEDTLLLRAVLYCKSNAPLHYIPAWSGI